MSRLNNFVKLLIGCCVAVLYVKGDVEDNSVIRKIEELQEIREIFTKSSKEYTDARIKEINTILGSSSSKWDFIRDISDILVWWSIDMNGREDIIKSKLPSILSNINENNAFQELKQELKVNLEAATKFWHNEVDKRLKRLRENPSAQEKDSFLFQKMEQLNNIKEKHLKIARDIIDKSEKEIKSLLDITTARWFIFKEADPLDWWIVDIERRHEFLLSKLPSLLDNYNENNYNKLKKEFDEGLAYADKFWHDELEKKMNQLREDPEVIKELITGPTALERLLLMSDLPSEGQIIFMKQIMNLTDVATQAKDIIFDYYSNKEPDLPEEYDISYMTRKTKFDAIMNRIRDDKFKNIDARKTLALNEVTTIWRMRRKHGPIKEEFDKVFTQLKQFGENVIKDVDKSYNEDFALFSK